MKKFFALFLGLMVPAILLAQNVQMMQPQNHYILDTKYLQAPANPIPFTDPKAEPTDKTLAAKQIDQAVDAYFSYYGTVSPVAYEPISKTLVHVQNLRENVSGVQKGTVYAMYSTNNGTTWSQKKALWSEDNKFSLFPSVALVNLDATNNPANLVYYVYSPYYDMTQSNYAGALFNYNYKQVRSTSFEWGPKANQYRWWENKLVAVNGNAEGFVYGVGQLDPEPNNQFGLFGFFGNYVDDIEPQATASTGMPPQWGKDRFRDPNNLNSTYLVNPNIDVDQDGNVYVSNNTYFPSDENSRVVGVSKSTNNGQSWSEFDPMPISVITEWAANEGSITDNINFWGPVWVVFSQDAFVVTGVDQYSYFYRLWTSTDGQQFNGYHIVEAFRKGDGVWGMRKVADYNPNPIYLSLDQDNEAAIKDTIIENRFLNELQAAKTANGSHVVLKWIEPTEKEVSFDPPFSYVGQGSQGQDTTYTFSAMNTTDIFVAYRETASDSWSNAKNVTNDDLYNKCTQMPIIVPDINNIPIFEMASVEITNTTHPWYGHYSRFMQQLKVDPWYTQNLMFTNFNATGSVDVETVEAPSAFRLNDVYPNPVVNGHAEISFSIDRNADTRLELFNSLGQFVKLLQAGELPTGPYAVNVNTNDLPSGVYYYTLTVAGETLTKTMTVIK